MPKHAAESCFITVVPEPRSRHTHLVVSGEIDMSSRSLFTAALPEVTDGEPVAVVVDLAPVTFAGATLVNFLLEVRDCLPDSAALTLCRPAPRIERVLRAAGLTRVASVHRDIPACRCCPPADHPVAALRQKATADAT